MQRGTSRIRIPYMRESAQIVAKIHPACASHMCNYCL